MRLITLQVRRRPLQEDPRHEKASIYQLFLGG